MIYKYDTEKLKQVIWDFYNVTGISVCILDSELNRIVTYPDPLVRFCSIIQNADGGRRICEASDCELIARCIETRRAETHTCHAGLVDTVVPILKGEVLLGFVIFGQVGHQSSRKKPFSGIYKKVSSLNIDKAELRAAYDELEFFPEEKIKSAAMIVTMLTKYIMLERIIQPDYDDSIEKIIEYIDVNITDDLSVPFLCNKFNVSKNTLYGMFKQHFEVKDICLWPLLFLPFCPTSHPSGLSMGSGCCDLLCATQSP